MFPASSESDKKMIDPNEAQALTSMPSGQLDGSNNTRLGPPEKAKYFEMGDSVVSYDPQLNSDGEALYHFLLSESTPSPFLRISCRGSKFNFCIDIVPYYGPVVLWSVADNELAYRGSMESKAEGSTFIGSQAAKAWKVRRKAWERWGGNPPPWYHWHAATDTAVNITTDGSDAHLDGLRSSKSLRQWADEYCASPKVMKEFVFKKVVYGWDLKKLEDNIRSTIKSSPCLYDGIISITLIRYRSIVRIRPGPDPANLKSVLRKLLSLLLFRVRDGGRWEVCGSACEWVPATSFRAQGYVQTPTGPKAILWENEDDWLKYWKNDIIRAVTDQYHSSIPLNNGFFGF